MTRFEHLEILADDPILGLADLFARDTRPGKMDLGVGIYKDPAGRTPVMAAVKLAEQWLVDNEATKAYTSTAGVQGFAEVMGPLLLGQSHTAQHGVVQTPGGTGALRLMGEFLSRSGSAQRVLIGVPTWPIHASIFERAGLQVSTYAHLTPTGEFNLGALLDSIDQARPGDAVLLHACCHNPTGIDPTREQWQSILEAIQRKGLLPLFDMAYQGFGDGLDADAWALRLFCAQLPEVLISASCSKNFGLYRERTGALLVHSDNARNLQAARTQIIDAARSLWSMPPSHGAAVVTRILNDESLKTLWLAELEATRLRINGLRDGLCQALKHIDAYAPFHTLAQQKGMFSNLGRTPAFVQGLRERAGIYMVGQGRINVSGIDPQRLDALAGELKAALAS